MFCWFSLSMDPAQLKGGSTSKNIVRLHFHVALLTFLCPFLECDQGNIQERCFSFYPFKKKNHLPELHEFKMTILKYSVFIWSVQIYSKY
jgi:hypothetical protein